MAVVRLEVARRTAFAEGQAFGEVGPYRLVEGTAHFAVDPSHRANEVITDIELAPRDSGGLVRFSADFAMLQPVDPERGRHRVFFGVLNRGRKGVLSRFNRAEAGADPEVLHPGNGFLMRHGYTVVWCGWQADVPPVPGLMGLQAPETVGADGGPLRGGIFCQFQSNELTDVFMLSHRGHLPHPPADIDDRAATLTVRDLPKDPPEVIGRDEWSFVRAEDEQVEPEPHHIYKASGFEQGRIYQLVYETRGSKVMGLGLVAVRDIVSFLKYGHADDGNPCAGDIEYAYGFGASQSCRFLRELCFLGQNEDEEGRIAFDGIIPHMAGGLRGEFNMRFGQPSQDICYINPGGFPFTDTESTDPVTGDRGGLLAKLEERGKVPKILFTNTSAEYWRGDGALIHTDLERMTDAMESASVRRYLFAGNQHGSGTFPPAEARPPVGVRGHLPFNAVDYTPLLRAALDNLDRWVSTGEPPPPSNHPSFAHGTAVESHTLAAKFSRLPGVRFPPRPLRAIRLDYGPDAAGAGRPLCPPSKARSTRRWFPTWTRTATRPPEYACPTSPCLSPPTRAGTCGTRI